MVESLLRLSASATTFRRALLRFARFHPIFDDCRRLASETVGDASVLFQTSRQQIAVLEACDLGRSAVSFDAQFAPPRYRRASRPGWLGRRTAAPERLDEFAQRLLVHVGNGDIGEVRIRPARDMVAVDRFDSACPRGRPWRRAAARSPRQRARCAGKRGSASGPCPRWSRARPPAGSPPARDRRWFR